MPDLPDGTGHRSTAIPILLLMAAACSPTSSTGTTAGDAWQGTATEEGLRRTVRTTAGSSWGGDGRLVEEVAIGTESRGENDMLGEVWGLTATGDRILIADASFNTVRAYDMAGNHVMNIGRPGGGPGEFRSITDVEIDPVRRQLVVREASAVLHRFTLDGEYLGTAHPRRSGAMLGPEPFLRITRDGVIMMRHRSLRPGTGTDSGLTLADAFFTIDSAGTFTDSLDLPRFEDDPWMLRARAGNEAFRPEPVPFGPVEVWCITHGGALVRGVPSEYRFQVRYADGRRLVIEKEADAVPVLPAERKAARERVYGIMRGFQPGWAWNGPDIPDTKPFYSAVIPDRSGRLWVLRDGVGRPVEGWTRPDSRKGWERNPAWVAERWFEVFSEATGRYLGRVDVPAGFVSAPEPFIDGDTFIALTEDDVGRPVVRRFRLVLPGSSVPPGREPATAPHRRAPVPAGARLAFRSG